MASNIKELVFETGVAITDHNSEATITLSCFKPNEVPCVILTSHGLDGNANANLALLALAGSVWTAKIITSAPNITVYYRAITTNGSVEEFNLITQNLFDVLTQNNDQIQIQVPFP